jgi:hypothetical protein
MKKIGCVYEALVGEDIYVVNPKNIDYANSAHNTYRRMTGYEVYRNGLRFGVKAIVFKLKKKFKTHEKE